MVIAYSRPDGSTPVELSQLLLLTDGRFPSGGYAHSGGLESAAAAGGVHDLVSLREFLTGRLATVGTVAAAFAAAGCAAARDPDAAMGALSVLDDEFGARTPSPALRTASQRLGRQLLRAGRTVWPDARLDALSAAPGRGPYQPLALGAVACCARLQPDAAALAAAHEVVIGPAMATVRLLGLDPFAVHALTAGLGTQIAAVAAGGASHAHTPPGELPAAASPLLDVRAEDHATWEVRLFAS